ncbi:antitoxin of toxin-antitoxin stability system [Acidisoma cellulosilytica]|uniref:Antitoxin of toxin-antitoxin stability system n=1 Tax=Acidisoma cellulosilyticum TaxID=2802395 RepID=A0A964E699_9PROT|nr:antitoxin of toxin-antitoxin stability system [Acidisoma cellulosilyticum]MCB8883485.1 antitoxin of toxin-antitoxin stability system [Acidisoma cellulosilyticum]
MSQETSLTLTVDTELQNDFLAEAKAADRGPSDIIEEFMREFVARQKEARAYEDFVRLKVEKARQSLAAGRFRSNDEVEADFAARRNAPRGA